MALVNRVVATEALALAVAAGLDEDATLELVQSGTGGSWQVQHWRETQALAADSTTGPEGMAAMARKDLDLALRLAAGLAVPLPVTAQARDHTVGMFSDSRRRITGPRPPA
jgi:3-hydroxyisobutyrate dehydrogenase-like beta-hydroxyacid dehydrogenase